MSIKPVCDVCKKELLNFGGLLFSPPDKAGRTKKYHICTACYQKIIKKYVKS